MGDTRDLLVKINGDVSGFKKAMGEMNDSTNGIQKSLENATRGSEVFTAGVAAAGAAVIGFGLKAVSAFQESQQVDAQLAAVLESTHHAAGLFQEDIQDQATALEHLTGVSDEAVKSGAAMLATFTNIKGPQFQGATQAILDMATAMNGGAIPNMDQMRQQAIMVGKALNDPEKGLTKLMKVGVTFSDQQKEQVKAMQAVGNVAGAQQVILAELNKEFGGSAAAAGKTFTGQMNIAKETFGDFMELVGQGIVNHLQPMVKAFNDWMTSMGGPDGMLKGLIAKLKELQPYLPVIAGVIIGGMVPALYAAAAAVWALMAPLLPFLAIGAAIGFLVKALIQHFGGLQGVMAALQPVLKVIHDIFATFILPVLQDIWAVFTTQLLPALRELWEQIGPILMPVLKVLGEILGGALLIAIMAFVGAIDLAVRIITIIVHAITGIVEAGKDLVAWFGRMGPAIGAAMKGIADIITWPFRMAFNAIALMWNNTLGKIHFTLPDWVPGIGGKGFEMPKIPYLAEGGIVTKPTLALLGEAGQQEAVIPLNKLGQMQTGGHTFNLSLNLGVYAGMPMEKRQIAVELWKEIVREARAHNVQLPQIGVSPQ